MQVALQRAIDAKYIDPGTAAKVRGSLGWVASQAFGCCGRLGTQVLSRRQYGHTRGLFSVFECEMLRFLQDLMSVLPHGLSMSLGLYSLLSASTPTCPMKLTWSPVSSAPCLGSVGSYLTPQLRPPRSAALWS